MLSTFKITTEMVRNKLASLKMNKAPGVDQVSTNMLMELSPVIIDVVTELFNKLLLQLMFLQNGSLPMSHLYSKKATSQARLTTDLLV